MCVFLKVNKYYGYLRKLLASTEQCVNCSEQLCRAHLDTSLGDPICMRHDSVLRTIGCMLMGKLGLSARDLTHEVFATMSDKRIKYGDSMQYPMRSFSKLSVIEQLNLKIDDKLCIVYNSKRPVNDQVYLDIICYILLCKTMLQDTNYEYKRRDMKWLTSKIGIFIMASLTTLALWPLVIIALDTENELTTAGIIIVFITFIIVCLLVNKRGDSRNE